MLVITSFNEALMNQYGLRMVHEFSEKSAGDVDLKVVFEGDEIPNIKINNVEFMRFHHAGHQNFVKKFGHLHEARGLRIFFQPNNQVNLTHDFKFDALRFSFKIFAVLQVLESCQPKDHFAWMDADVRCLKNFSHADLAPFLPEPDQLMSYLGRNNFPPTGAYSECGFLGFNARHPALHDFLHRMADTYVNGGIFSHEQWHDSWIWDQTRMEFERQGISFKNISGAAVNTEHPFINCGLGVFFDHLKGPQRKQAGHSFINDYKMKPGQR